MGGREPLSLFRGRGCFLMWHASSESLMCRFSCWSRMVTSLNEDLPTRTSLTVQEVVRLLSFCLNATYLSFRGEHYQQTFGTAMGSPVSVTVANLVMEDVEGRALATTDIPLRFWKRYVDDTCTALPRSRCQELLEHLNSTEATIQFTLELESEGKLPFLDVLLQHHGDGSISTSVFRKPTHTDKYLDFTSHHPWAHKAAVAHTLRHRAGTHSSTFGAFEKEKAHVMDALLKNGYPKRYIHQSVNIPHPPRTTVAEKPKATVCLPYIKGVSEPLKRVLDRLEIRTVLRPHRTLKQTLVHPKGAIPNMQKSSVVYCIPCAECPATYVGETKRKLCKRVDEHRRAVRMADFNSSALAEHAWSAGHNVDWSEVTILDQHENLHMRLSLEACHIRKQPLPLNRDKGSLPPTYDHLLKNS